MAKNKYLHLLFVMLLILIFLPFFDDFKKGNIPIISLVFLLGLTMTMWAIDLPKKVFYSFASTAVLVYILEAVLKSLPPSAYRLDIAIFTWFVYALFILACVVVMMKKLSAARRVTLDAIVGGINIYFLLAFMWALFYNIINMLDPEAFNIKGKIDITRLIYFSYNTISTLGNGDIVPVNRLAMIVSSLEAITGQMYLAIFVATLVSLHIANRMSNSGKV